MSAATKIPKSGIQKYCLAVWISYVFQHVEASQVASDELILYLIDCFDQQLNHRCFYIIRPISHIHAKVQLIKC